MYSHAAKAKSEYTARDSVPAEQVPCVDLARHVREVIVPTVGDDHVRFAFERVQVVRDLAAEEIRASSVGS